MVSRNIRWLYAQTWQSASCAYLFSRSRSGGVHETRISRRWTCWNQAFDIQPSSSSYAYLVHNISTCVIIELKSRGFLFYLRCSLPSGFLLSCFFFFSFICSLAFFSVVGWRSVCALGGPTGLCTSMEGSELYNRLCLGLEMIGRMVMWMQVIILGRKRNSEWGVVENAWTWQYR